MIRGATSGSENKIDGAIGHAANMFSLGGLRALVIGARCDIGKGTALAFATCGA